MHKSLLKVWIVRLEGRLDKNLMLFFFFFVQLSKIEGSARIWSSKSAALGNGYKRRWSNVTACVRDRERWVLSTVERDEYKHEYLVIGEWFQAQSYAWISIRGWWLDEVKYGQLPRWSPVGNVRVDRLGPLRSIGYTAIPHGRLCLSTGAIHVAEKLPRLKGACDA